MSRLTVALSVAAGTLALSGAATPPPAADAAHVMTIMSPVTTSDAVRALAVRCRSGLKPLATVAAHGKAGQRVPYTLYLNNKVARKGTLKANRAGTFAVSSTVADHHRTAVRLRLVNHTAVSGYVMPSCTRAAAPTVVKAAATSTAPGGSASSYTLNLNRNGTVSRWDPCSGDIHVLVNVSQAPSGALTDVKAALATLGKATGLHFVYDGATSFVPNSSNASNQPAALVIAWAPAGSGAGRSDYYGAGAVGEGGWRSSGSSTNGGKTWNWKISQGFVVLDPTVKMASGFGTGVTRGALLLHELGHVAGLNHTTDGAQIMYPSLRSSTVGHYGAGDNAGLKAVGSSRGCTTAS